MALTHRALCSALLSWVGLVLACNFDSSGFSTVELRVNCGDTPHGETQTRKRFKQELVPFGSECQEETQTRTCENGSFSDWTGTFAALSCVEGNAASCGNIPHGGKTEPRTRYETATVPFGQTCNSEQQTRSCENGKLSDWSGTFRQRSCSEEPPAGCGNLADGESEFRTRFEIDMVPLGGSCSSEEQSRVCQNGSFGAWSGTFTFDSCACQASGVSCNNLCIDPQTDNNFCGATADCLGANAGNPCAAAETCMEGTCKLLPSWQAASALYTGGGATEPRLVLGPNADAIALWKVATGAITAEFWMASYDRAVDLWTSTKIDAIPAAVVEAHRLAIDSRGNRFLIWRQWDLDIKARVRISRYTASTSTWSAPTVLTHDNSAHAVNQPQVAFGPNGDAVAVWVETKLNQPNKLLVAEYSSDSNMWSDPRALQVGEGARWPKVALDDSGNAFIAWINKDSEAWASRRDSAGDWHATQLEQRTEPGESRDLQLAVSASGDAILIWEARQQGSAFAIRTARYTVDSDTWDTNASPVIETSSAAPVAAETPRLAMNAAGEAVALWSEVRGTDRHFNTNRTNTQTQTWNGDKTLVSYRNNNAEIPFIVLDDANNAVSAWRETPGGPIFSSRSEAENNPWQTPIRLTDNTAAANPLALAVGRRGEAFLLWADGAGKIWLRHYR